MSAVKGAVRRNARNHASTTPAKRPSGWPRTSSRARAIWLKNPRPESVWNGRPLISARSIRRGAPWPAPRPPRADRAACRDRARAGSWSRTAARRAPCRSPRTPRPPRSRCRRRRRRSRCHAVRAPLRAIASRNCCGWSRRISTSSQRGFSAASISATIARGAGVDQRAGARIEQDENAFHGMRPHARRQCAGRRSLLPSGSVRAR